jgi:hypothetical protein
MKYKDADVVSRLDESTLEKLAGKSANVTYYSARTRPFDLVTLYRQIISGAADDVVVGQLRQVRYTEGYSYLIGLSLVLWLASSPWGLPTARTLVLSALLLSSCSQRIDDGEAAFQAKLKRGGELLQFAQEQHSTDLVAERSLLLDAREQFLCAALLRPGHVETARRITAISRRLREVDAAIEEQRAEEKKRREKLDEIVQRLEKLALRQAGLSQQSTRLLARRQVASKAKLNAEDYNIIDYIDDGNTTASRNNERRLASPAAQEQQAVREGTASVLESVTIQRDTLRRLLTKAYGDVGRLPATELDPIADLLTEAVAAQQQALASLDPKSLRWPQANTAFHTAAGRMQQALESLRSLQPPSDDQNDHAMPAKKNGDYDEDMAGADSDTKDNKSPPVAAGDFQAALSQQSLPVPNYTSAEILAEESANQQKRIKSRTARAGAKVEKNW